MAILLDGTAGITTPGLTNTGTETIVNLTTTGNTILGDASTDTLNVGNGGLVKDASGNVGIGTASPDAKLRVNGATKIGEGVASNTSKLMVNTVSGVAAGIQLFQDGNESWIINNPASSTALTFANSGTERMRIDSSGNVGVGTSSPNKTSIGRALTVNGSANAGVELAAGDVCYGLVFANSSRFSLDTNNSGANIINFYTSNAERARIDSSGNLLVGTTSGAWIGRISAAADSAGAFYPLAVNNTNTGTNSQVVVDIYRNGTRTGYITNSNNSTSFTSTSDYRLKEDIQPMQNALAKVSTLKPVTYKWKSDGSDGQGFIAHELQDVFPDAVHGEKDAADKDGNPFYQGIDTSFLVATLTAAIQELKALVDTQASTITQLQADVEALKAQP